MEQVFEMKVKEKKKKLKDSEAEVRVCRLETKTWLSIATQRRFFVENFAF